MATQNRSKLNRRGTIHSSGTFAASLRQGRSTSWRTWEKIVWVLAGVLVCTMMLDVYHRQGRINNLRGEIADIDNTMEVNRLEYQRLQQEREYKRSEAYVERFAREELGWLREGDYYIIFP